MTAEDVLVSDDLAARRDDARGDPVATASATRTYWQCGWRMRSEIPLSLPPLPAGGPCDVDVRWGAPGDSTAAPPGQVIAAQEHDGKRWYTATDDGPRYRLRFHACGEVLITRDLRHVTVHPDPGGRDELLPVLVAGTVSAFLLMLAGGCVLHASAVDVDGAAVAFVGQSGRGKSTMAALLCAAGHRLVTDDVLLVEPGPPATCAGGSMEVRLRPGSYELAATFPDPAASTRRTADQRLALGPPAVDARRYPLGAIVVPAPSRTAADVAISRLSPADAVVTLLSFPRIFGWQRHDVVVAQFEATSALAAAVPVYQARIPWGPPFRADVAPAIAALAGQRAG